MRYVIWGLSGFFALFLFAGALIEDSETYWVMGAVVFFGGFALGNWAEKNL